MARVRVSGSTFRSNTISRFPLVEACEQRVFLSASYGANLLVNPGAEAGPGSFTGDDVEPLPGWTTQGAPTAVVTGAEGTFLPGPPSGGNNFFAGGPNAALSIISQTIDVSNLANDIDHGSVKATLAGYLGGWMHQNDNSMLVATFKTDGGAVLSTVSIGPVLATDRDSLTALLYRNQRVNVPIGTGSIEVSVRFTRDTGDYNDGYADNLSLVLARGDRDFVAGADAGADPEVRVYDAPTGAEVLRFDAFAAGFRGGIRVASGDVTGDGVPDIVVGAGPGAGPHVKIFDGTSGNLISGPLASFFAFDPAFSSGMYVAAGDVTGDGKADVIVAAGTAAGPHVKVFNGSTGATIASFWAFDPGFHGGIRVAAGDVDGDGKADIVVGAGPGAGPHVKVFSGANFSQIRSFYAFDPGFDSGIYVSAGDVNGDGRADVVVSADGGSNPHVTAFDVSSGAVQFASFFAYDPLFRGGVRVAVMDVNGDNHADILTSTGPGAVHFKAFDGQTLSLLESFIAYDGSESGAFLGAT